MTMQSKGMRALWSERRKEMVKQRQRGWPLQRIADYHGVDRANCARMIRDEIARTRTYNTTRSARQVAERHAKIIELREEGYSYREIAERVGLAAQNCHVVYKQHEAYTNYDTIAPGRFIVNSVPFSTDRTLLV